MALEGERPVVLDRQIMGLSDRDTNNVGQAGRNVRVLDTPCNNCAVTFQGQVSTEPIAKTAAGDSYNVAQASRYWCLAPAN